MLAPEIRVIRDRRVFGVDARRRGIEQMKSFGRDARDHFRRHAAPRECFADAKQPSGARDRGEHGVGIERLDRAQIDHFDLDAIRAELLRDRERFVHHRAVGHDAEIASRPNDSRFPDRQPLLRQGVGLEMVIKIFVLAVDDRVVDRDRIDQHRVGVLHRGRRHHDQSRDNASRSLPCSGCGMGRCLSFRRRASAP